MAQKVNIATGNWSTAATWGSVTNTPTLHASTNINVSTSNVFTPTFTAPNTTNACKGVLFYLASKGSSTTLNVTLQESTVDTAATVAITLANVTAGGSTTTGTWFYAEFASPYTFTTTSAGAYRFKLNVNSSSINLAADSGATTIHYMAIDDRTGVPASTDDVWIVGANGSTARTVTVTGTSNTIGSGGDTTTTTVNRVLTFGIQLCNKGKLAWDTTADATLTCKGTIWLGTEGSFEMGSTGTPVSSSAKAKLIFDENGTTSNFGLLLTTNPTSYVMQGTPKSSTSLWKAKYVSGSGTAASPLVVDASVDWTVNDQIVITATSDNSTNYNESEVKYIKTKNSATSYVLSDTVGGAESALSNTHTTNAWVLNIERNAQITTTNASHGFYWHNLCTDTSAVNIDWARFENIGLNSNVTEKSGGVTLGRGSGWANCDYSVVKNWQGIGFDWNGGSITAAANTFTGLIAYDGAGSGGITQRNTVYNKHYVDCFVIKTTGRGFAATTITNVSFTRCYGTSTNTSGSTTGGAFVLQTLINGTFIDCEAQANRWQGVNYIGSTVRTTFTNFLCGTKGKNTTQDIFITSGVVADTLYDNSLFGSDIFITGDNTLQTGSLIRFHKLNQTDNNHIWYTENGNARSTGAGLADTTVRTTGSLGLRIASGNASPGLDWSFQIPAKANSIVSFFGYFQKNAAFGTDVATVELFLPGSTVADASQTLSNTTGSWQAVSISANYTSSVSGLATVKVTAKSATASAYIYVDDLYNAGDGSSTTSDKVTGLDVWYEGQPQSIIAPSAVSAADIWTFPTSNLTTTGTTGKQVKDALTVGKFLGLR